MTQSAKDEAKFLDTRLDDETAAVLEKWNLAILGAALLHDADHIRQAIRWHYKIPMQLWIINLAVYVLPTVGEFLLKNKRTSVQKRARNAWHVRARLQAKRESDHKVVKIAVTGLSCSRRPAS